MIAAEKGYTNIVQALLDGGADVQATEPGHSRTALHLAVDHGHLTTVQTLIGHRADVQSKDAAGISPFILGVKQKRSPIVKALLAERADVNERDKQVPWCS